MSFFSHLLWSLLLRKDCKLWISHILSTFLEGYHYIIANFFFASPGGILGSVVSTETKASGAGAGAGAGADSDAEPGRHPQEKHVPQHANHCKE